MVILHLLGSVLVFLATLSFYVSLYTRAASIDPFTDGSFAGASDAGTSSHGRTTPRSGVAHSGDDSMMTR